MYTHHKQIFRRDAHLAVSAVGVAPPRHRARLDWSARLDGEHQARTSLTGKPIRDE